MLAVTLLIPSTLFGASLQPRSLEQLIHAADFIVRGTVQSVTPGPHKEEDAFSTTVVISVRKQWKGTRLSSLRLIQSQGTQGGITHAVPGLPTFLVGEEVILFVVQDGQGQYHVLGGKQGKFLIQIDPQSGKRVIEDLTGARSDLTQFLARLGAASKVGP
jgi:hypothetical protein